MDCQICSRRGHPDRKLVCASCARSVLYQPRVALAKTLLAKAALSKAVAFVVSPDIKPPDVQIGKIKPIYVAEHKETLKYESLHTEATRLRALLGDMTLEKTRLEDSIERYQADKEARKLSVVKKRTSLEQGRLWLINQKAAMTEPVTKQTKKISRRYNNTREATISSRLYLCRDAASLAALRIHRIHAANACTIDRFTIGGVDLVDLRDLGKLKATHMTSSLGNVARLLMLVCRYLQIHPPAQITLPHPDEPLPTIFPTSSSYLSGPTSFPTTSTSPHILLHSSLYENYRTPRPLFIEQDLSVLAKEDPGKFYLFIEGVVLLAWNVAWLCRLQGRAFATHDFEDICALPRNLWLLLVASPEQLSTAQMRILEAWSASTDAPAAADDNRAKYPEVKFGVFSHGTSYAQLGNASTREVRNLEISMSAWHFKSWQRVADMLKAYLMSDITGAEWEVLDDTDFKRGLESRLEDTYSNTKGWTKLKSRSGALET